MKHRHLLSLLLIVPFLCPALRAQNTSQPAGNPRRAALIFGPRHAFTIRAPDRWTLDTRSGQGQGLQAVFYPDGERWSTSSAVMYCQVVARGKDIKDLRGIIEYDQARHRNSAPGAVTATEPPIPLGGGKTASVLRFSGGGNGNFSQTAYIEERSVIVLVNLSCRSAEAFDRSLGGFTDFVKSYTFLADDEENILRAVEAAELDAE